MNRTGKRAWILCTVLFAMPLAAFAQQDVPEGVSDEVIAAVLEQDRHALRRIAAELASQRVDVVDFSYVEPSGDNADGGFLVGYKWNKEASEQSLATEDGVFSLRRRSWGIDIDGTYAFEDAANNDDLSTVSAYFSMQRGEFGRVRSYATADIDAVMDCLEREEELNPMPEDEPADSPAWDAWEQAARGAEPLCWADNGLGDFAKPNGRSYVYGIDFHAALEGDQNYSDTNTTFGLSAVLSAQPTSETQNLNIFDFPFRLMRQTFGDETDYVAPFPSVKVDIDRVDGGENEIRSALTTESDYTRGSAEVAFQTVLANVKGQPVRFNVSYRYYHEFSAPAAVEAAGLDSFDYVEASLRFPARMLPFLQTDEYEFFVSYTDGQLPFDTQSESAVEIGFATNISQLARLFAD